MVAVVRGLSRVGAGGMRDRTKPWTSSSSRRSSTTCPARPDEPWQRGGISPRRRAPCSPPIDGAGARGRCRWRRISPRPWPGSDRASRCTMVLEWLRRVPDLIRSARRRPGRVRVGLKLFNTLEDDDFQLRDARRGPRRGRPDFLVYANRLFDPDREFEGQRGVAYGGPDLSDRNLRLLSALRARRTRARSSDRPWRSVRPAISARGGSPWSMPSAVARASRSTPCSSSPPSEFAMRVGSRVQRALAPALLRPRGWLHHLDRPRGPAAGPRSRRAIVRFLDLARRGAASALTRRDLDSRSS